jgi:hypothetical protein
MGLVRSRFRSVCKRDASGVHSVEGTDIVVSRFWSWSLVVASSGMLVMVWCCAGGVTHQVA